MPNIVTFTPSQATVAMPVLIALLQDAVESGASIGFLPTLARDEAEAYWHGVIDAIRDGSRVLLLAHEEDTLVGSAQLDLCTKANDLHRAEVSKVMVHSAHRRKGIGHALMLALDDAARVHNRTTLVLDTRAGDPSERLYQSLGWVRVGEIPRYARSADGTLHTTALYFELLP